MNSEQLLDDLDIYVALSHIASGLSVAKPNSKAVAKLLRRHQDNAEIAQLLRPDGTLSKALRKRIQALWNEGVFHDQVKAKKKFPTHFGVSPKQAPGVAVVHGDLIGGINNKNDNTRTKDDVIVPDVQHQAKLSIRPSSRAPWLSFVRIPFLASHKILVRTQEILEKACFEYAIVAMPAVVQRLEWECAESVELSLWMQEFRLRDGINWKMIRQNGMSHDLDRFYISIQNIRHKAVHRENVTATQLETLIADACGLARVINDEDAIKQLGRIQQEIQKAITEMVEKKVMLESNLRAALAPLQAQRVELDRLEEATREKSKQEEDEQNMRIGLGLLDYISKVQEGDIVEDSSLRDVLTVMDGKSHVEVPEEREGENGGSILKLLEIPEMKTDEDNLLADVLTVMDGKSLLEVSEERKGENGDNILKVLGIPGSSSC